MKRILMAVLSLALPTMVAHAECTIPLNVTIVPAVSSPCAIWAQVQKSYDQAVIRMETFDRITGNLEFRVPLHEDGLPLTIVEYPELTPAGLTGEFTARHSKPTIHYGAKYERMFHTLDHEMGHWLWWKRYCYSYPAGQPAPWVQELTDLYTRDWYLNIGHGNKHDLFVIMTNAVSRWLSNIPVPSSYDPGQLPQRTSF